MLRHNELRDITATLLKKCHDVRTEPPLVKVNGEVLNEQTANIRPEARLDISLISLGFWTPDQRVFFDMRGFNLHAQRYRCLELKRCFERNEKEKKRQYNECFKSKMGHLLRFVVFATNVAMSLSAKPFTRMAEMVAEKRKVCISVATSVIWTKISFSLVND